MRILLVIALLLGGAMLTGCDSSNEGGSATVRVLLTDAPFPFHLVDSANVAIERVELIGDGGREVLLDSTHNPIPFNLLDLRDGVTAELAVHEVPGGRYTQLRVIVSEEAEVVLIDEDPADDVPARRFALRVPSGAQTGIKLNLPRIDVDEEGETVEVVVDFDVEHSFVVQGNPETPAGINGFTFKPVLKIERLVINGDEVPESDFPAEDRQP